MPLIKRSWIKVLKLALVSPVLEKINIILFLFSLPIIVVKFLTTPKYISMYTNHANMTRLAMREKLNQVKDLQAFKSYLEELVNDRIYKTSQLPIVIPLGAIRAKRYSYSDSCPVGLSNCNRDQNCMTNYYISSLQSLSQCSLNQFSKNREIQNSSLGPTLSFSNENFYGKYSSYGLLTQGETYDFTLGDFSQVKEVLYQDIQQDLHLRGVFVLLNVYSPDIEVYNVIVIALEMLPGFREIQASVNVNVFYHVRELDLLFYIAYISLIASTASSLLMLLYRMNLKPRFIIHSFSLMAEVFNCGLITFYTLYSYAGSPSANLELEIRETRFINYFTFITLKKYTTAFLALVLLTYPYKLFSAMTWFRFFSPIRIYSNIIFKLSPGIVLVLFICSSIWLSFCLVFNILYSEYSFNFSTLLNSMVFSFSAIFNVDQFSKIHEDSGFPLLFLLFNLMFFAVLLLMGFLFIATMVYNFKVAYNMEISTKDPLIEKLDELQFQIEEITAKKKIDHYSQCEKRLQVLWLNLTENNDVYRFLNDLRDFSEDTFNKLAETNFEPSRIRECDALKNIREAYYKYLIEFRNLDLKCINSLVFMHYTASNQIISFLKYLFAIKPNIRYNDLDRKFVLVIQLKGDKKQLNDFEINELEAILDWLNYIGLNLKVIVYSQSALDKRSSNCIGLSYENSICCYSKVELVSNLISLEQAF